MTKANRSEIHTCPFCKGTGKIEVMTIGTRFRALRGELTQEAFAKRVKVARVTISNIETGHAEPSISLLHRVADQFNVSTDYLLGRDGEPDAACNVDYLVKETEG